MKPMSIVIILVFTFFGACIGLLIGQKTAPHHTHHINSASHGEIDSFYTNTLKVSEEQKRLLAPIDRDYLKQKQTYIEQMAMSNYKLANIIEQNGYESPDVAEVVMEINRVIRALQHLTLQHLTQVKSVLTKEQAQLLKDHVVQRLYQKP